MAQSGERFYVGNKLLTGMKIETHLEGTLTDLLIEQFEITNHRSKFGIARQE